MAVSKRPVKTILACYAACPRPVCSFLDELIACFNTTFRRLALGIKAGLIGFRCVDAFEADLDTPDFHSIAVMDARDAPQIRGDRADRSEGQ